MINLPPAERAVFINCPFDEGYAPLLQAMILGTVCCGFTPRSAIDSGQGAALRLDRILDALRGSRYSIHDLSRCKGEGAQGLARFNMPLELGIAIGLRHALPNEHHDFLTLVPADHEYARFVSDLAGLDPSKHDGTPSAVLKRVMSWLETYAAVRPPDPPKVAAALAAFAIKWAESEKSWGQVRWFGMVEEAAAIARSL